MPRLQKVGALALAVLIVQIVLSKWVYPMFEKTTTTFFSIEPSTGIGGQAVGNKVLGYLTGYIPFDLTNWAGYIAMYIGAFALVWAGLWLYDTKFVRSNLYTGKSLGGRIFAILLYGHAILYVVLLLMQFKVPGIAWSLLIGLAVNLVAVSLVVGWSAKKLNFPRI